MGIILPIIRYIIKKIGCTLRTDRDQIPLGELLLTARLAKKLSRAQLAEQVGISENSLVRYEKAGFDKDGQFPPSSKLAMLCFKLGISPRKALLGCLSEDEYWNYETDEDFHDSGVGLWLGEQYEALVKDNYFLRSVLKSLLGPVPVKGSWEAEQIEWMILQLDSMFLRQESFERRMKEYGGSNPGIDGGYSVPGKQLSDSDDRWIFDYRITGELPEQLKGRDGKIRKKD